MPFNSHNANAPADDGAGRSSVLRQLVDGLVCLAIAVMLFRAFEVEGYIISTGSMAPHLLGYHKRVVCPSCGHQFAHGVSVEEPASDTLHANADEAQDSGTDIGVQSPPIGNSLAVCPNCSQTAIDISRVPRNEGDQLLVHKQAFLWEGPRRWEVIVFRNPMQPTQAYVKRVVGLPGERVQVRHGDLFINGKLCRKNLDEQHALRIPVFNFAHRPAEDRDWEPRWIVPPEAAIEGDAIRFDAASAGAGVAAAAESVPDAGHLSGIAWVEYRHWIRRGGTHLTTVPLSDWPESVQVPDSLFSPVSYDPVRGVLTCLGVLSPTVRDALLVGTDDAEFRSAVARLYELSHSPGIIDGYGYNRDDVLTPHAAVRDVAWEAEVTLGGGEGEFVVALADGADEYACRFNLSTRNVTLERTSDGAVLQTTPLRPEWAASEFALEVSLIDRQVVVAVEGQPLFPAWQLADELDELVAVPRRPIRFGANSFGTVVRGAIVYRDVYYTRGTGRHGVNRAYPLGSDEYFVLGDNSPVSLDSREWPSPAVRRNMLLGKPFIVHLPSRPGLIRLGSFEGHIRIPDVSRIRYIR